MRDSKYLLFGGSAPQKTGNFQRCILAYSGHTCCTVEVEPADGGARRTEEPGLGRTTNATSAAGAHRATIVRKGGAILLSVALLRIKYGMQQQALGLTPIGGLRLRSDSRGGALSTPFEADLLLY